MKKDLPFKVLLVVIILISCSLLSITLPILIKLLISENPLKEWSGIDIQAHFINLYFGLGVGLAIVIFSILQLESEKQIKLVRFLLILSTMLTALSYILVKSVS